METSSHLKEELVRLLQIVRHRAVLRQDPFYSGSHQAQILAFGFAFRQVP
jgi:hypothetical protein